jgi:hypothetical protein
MFLVDSSNSMAESGNVAHLQAQELLVRYLDTVEQRATQRVGLIRFGTAAQLEIPLTATQDILAQGLLKEVWQPPVTSLGWTDPLAALELGYAELFSSTRYLPTQQQVLILVTDGEPATPSLNTEAAIEAYGDELRRSVMRMKRRGALFFTVTLNDETESSEQHGYPTSYRTLWQELTALTPPATYHEVSAVEQLPAVFHEIVAQLGGYTNLYADTLQSAAAVPREFNLEEDLLQAVFMFHPSTSSAPIRLTRPGGAVVRPEDPDVQISYSLDKPDIVIYVIETPRPGRWTLVSDENQQAEIWIDGLRGSSPAPEAGYQLRVKAPTHLLVGATLQADCQLLHNTREPLPRDEIQVKGMLLRAGFNEAQILGEKREGKYVLQKDDLDAGTYALQVQALQAGSVVADYETLFEVSAPPRLRVTQPMSGQRLRHGTALTVMAEVDCAYRCVNTWVEPGDGIVSGFIESDHLKRQPIVLTRTPKNPTHTSVITGLIPGLYHLTLQLQGTTRDHSPYEDAKTLSFQVLSPPSNPVNPWPWIWGSLLISSTSIGGWLSWRQHQRRPRLEGGWRILQRPATVHAARYLPLPSSRQRFTLKPTDLPELPTGFSMEARRGPSQQLEIWLKPGTGNHHALLQLNDHQVNAPIALVDGDVLRVGPYRMRYENVRQEARQRALGKP